MSFFASSMLAIAVTVVSGCGRPTVNSMSAATGSTPVYVRVPTSMLSAAWVQENSFNRDHGKNDQFALGWIPANQFARLSDAEKSVITTLDEKKVAHGQFNPFTLTEIHTMLDDIGASEAFHNYAALTAELKNLANAHSDIAQLESIGKSSQNRDLWLIRISQNIAAGQPKPKLLYIANMHGDEVVGRELSIYHIRRLLNDYGKDQRITNLVNNAEIFIVASMNPDGYELQQRANAKNVDLNRDFPDFTSDDHDTTNGRAIETAAIMELHRKHHFISAINYHGGEVCFNLPWDTKPNGTTAERFGDDAVLAKMGRTYADANTTMAANSSFDRGLTYGFEWYEVDGGMQDWSIYYRRSMHATVELSYTKWPSASTLPKAWEENRESMLGYMERSIVGVHIEVVDENGIPVNGIVVGVHSSGRTIQFDGNYAWRTTTDGEQRVTIAAEGFKTTSIKTNARSFDGQFERVILRR